MLRGTGRAFGLIIACCLTSIAAPDALARPAGGFGSSCVDCHGGPFLEGREVPNALVDVLSGTHAEIPAGQFGDPDRGEGPLATYTASPGGTFELTIQIKDPDPLVVQPLEWAAVLQRIRRTDPDFQAGNPDPLTWRDNQLALVGALMPGHAGSDIPIDETGWTLQTDGGVYNPARQDFQYYTSADVFGHDWIGALLMSLTVTVPAGVIPGWYDLEISVAGLDTDYYGFYDDEHFYLHVIPEPATALLAGAIAALALRRRTGQAD